MDMPAFQLISSLFGGSTGATQNVNHIVEETDVDPNREDKQPYYPALIHRQVDHRDANEKGLRERGGTKRSNSNFHTRGYLSGCPTQPG